MVVVSFLSLRKAFCLRYFQVTSLFCLRLQHWIRREVVVEANSQHSHKNKFRSIKNLVANDYLIHNGTIE